MTSPPLSDPAAEPAAGPESSHRPFAERRADLSARVHTLGRYGFARASEEPYRRRPADGFWLVVGIVVVASHRVRPAGVRLLLDQLDDQARLSLIMRSE